jgi:hypothetical protein
VQLQSPPQSFSFSFFVLVLSFREIPERENENEERERERFLTECHNFESHPARPMLAEDTPSSIVMPHD